MGLGFFGIRADALEADLAGVKQRFLHISVWGYQTGDAEGSRVIRCTPVSQAHLAGVGYPRIRGPRSRGNQRKWTAASMTLYSAATHEFEKEETLLLCQLNVICIHIYIYICPEGITYCTSFPHALQRNQRTTKDARQNTLNPKPLSPRP